MNEPHRKDAFCPACAVAKGRRKPYNKKRKGKEKQPRAEKPFECIHSDLMQASVPSVRINNAPSNFRYSIVYVDECTRMSWRYGLKTKDEAAQAFQVFIKTVVMPMGYRIYKLKCDPGGEFSGIFREFCRNNAIEIHYRQQQPIS